MRNFSDSFLRFAASVGFHVSRNVFHVNFYAEHVSLASSGYLYTFGSSRAVCTSKVRAEKQEEVLLSVCECCFRLEFCVLLELVSACVGTVKFGFGVR